MEITIVNKRNKTIGTQEFTEFDIIATEKNVLRYEVGNLTVDGFDASDLKCKLSTVFLNEDEDESEAEVEVSHYTAQTDFLIKLAESNAISNSAGKHEISIETFKEYSKTIEACDGIDVIEKVSEILEFTKEPHNSQTLSDCIAKAIYFYETEFDCTHNEAVRQTVKLVVTVYSKFKDELENEYMLVVNYVNRNENEHMGFMFDIVENARTGNLMDCAISQHAMRL